MRRASVAVAVVLTAVVAVAAPAVAAGPNLVQNGSFEIGYPGDFVCGAWWYSVGYGGGACDSNTTITGWLQTGGGVDWQHDSIPSEPVAADGSYFVDLIGSNDAGAIEQQVPTTPGASYVLSFGYSTNAGCVRLFGGGSASARAVAGGASRVVSSGPTFAYEHVALPFVAAAATTTISFTSLTSAGCGGIVVDAVSVSRGTVKKGAPPAVPRVDHEFLCYSTFETDPGVWPASEAASLRDEGYWPPYALAGRLDGGTNVGAFHLVCNLAGGKKTTGRFVDGGGGTWPSAYAGAPGLYPEAA
jgi:hypothetical protein